VGLRAGLDFVEKSFLPLPEIEPRLLSRPACSLVAIPAELIRLHMCRVLSLIRQTLAQSERYYACQILSVWQPSPVSLQQPKFEPCTFRINTSLERDRCSRLLGSLVMRATFFKFSTLSATEQHWPTVMYWPSTLSVASSLHRSAVHAGMYSQRCKTATALFDGSIRNEDITS
jgi:hypothetical protein